MWGIESFVTYVNELCREAENILRNQNGFKPVGEEWLSETELYKDIKDYYPHIKVIHSYRAKWLGLQHLDIFMYEYNIGIEYQGEQHYKPIKVFGGSEQIEKNKKRDMEKVKKCTNNDISIIHVFPKYEFHSVVDCIDSILKSK